MDSLGREPRLPVGKNIQPRSGDRCRKHEITAEPIDSERSTKKGHGATLLTLVALTILFIHPRNQ
jgi:hypothetical protein